MSDLKLCFGCMEPLGEETVCPHCGYDRNVPSLANYLKPGTMLHERFMVGKMLSANGEGVTYVGYDTSVDCKILIREYFPERLCSRVPNGSAIDVKYDHLAQYKALMAEYTELNKALARLRNLSHLNPALDMFSENNTTYAVYEYLEGRTLLDYLKENAGELSWNTVRRIFPPLFTTLSLLHNAGVLHRGLSPETIFVTDKGEIKLTGFCISASRTNDTELDAELFDGYAAPEQYFADKQQGTWTDVYGICAVLYRILTGCRASDAISRQDFDILVAPNEVNPKIPESVSEGIMQGLQLDSNARVRTITDLVTLLFEQNTAEDANAHETDAAAGSPHPAKGDTAVYETHHSANLPKASEHRPARQNPQNGQRRPAQPGQHHPNGNPQRSGRPPQNGQRRPQQGQNGQRRPAPGSSADAVRRARAQQSSGNGQPRRRPAAAAAGNQRVRESEITVFERIRAPLLIAILFIAIVTVVIWAFIRVWGIGAGNHSLFNNDEKSSANDNVIPVQTDDSGVELTPDSEIPDLIGKNFKIKRDEFGEWLILEPEYEFSDVHVKGSIFWQEFDVGTEFVSGSSMKVKVSLGSSIITIPNFKGQKLPTYLKKLEELGFVPAINGGGNNNMGGMPQFGQEGYGYGYGAGKVTTGPVNGTAETTVTTTSKNGKTQIVKYVATIDYNYQDGYVCAVTPEVGKIVDALDNYEIIVYYAYNPVYYTITNTARTGTSTTGTGTGTGKATKTTTGTGTTKTTTKPVTTEVQVETDPPVTKATDPPVVTKATDPPPPPETKATDPPPPPQTQPPATDPPAPPQPQVTDPPAPTPTPDTDA